MTKITIYASVLLVVIWIILCEAFTVTAVVTGVIISTVCLFFLYRFLPVSGTSDINYFRLAVYLLFLIAEIYLSGISAIKIIISGADVEIVKVRTQIKNGFLRTLLANSITLTPGTVTLKLSGDEITVLRLMEKSGNPPDAGDAGEEIKGKLERMLLKAQK